MATLHSYGATLKNNKTENEAALFVCGRDTRLKIPTREERKHILQELGLPLTFARAFDLVLVPDAEVSNILSVPVRDMTLVELKTTRKKLPNMPDGFFFGATANEFDLATRMGSKYMFCFVSLHPESMSHAFLTAQELESKIKNKRLQYQINL